MTVANAVRTFRSPGWYRGLLVAISLGLVTVGLYFTQRDGLSISSTTAIGAALFALIGLADALTTRVTVLPAALRVTSNLRSREYAREGIESVTWARGSGVAIKLRNGAWLNLPDVGNAQAVSNSIRAWMTREPAPPPPGAG